MNTQDTQPVDATPDVTYPVRWEHSIACKCGRCITKRGLLASRARRAIDTTETTT